MAQIDDNKSPSEELKGASLFGFSDEQIRLIFESELDVNLLYTLEVIAKSEIPIFLKATSKFNNWVQTLHRKQYVSVRGTVTTKGAALLAQLGAAVPGLSTYRPVSDLFNIWWSVYPTTSGFTYKGASFTSSQVKRIKKTLCRKHWDEILLEGEYTAEQIVDGTRNHIAMAMEESVKNKENRVHFIFNSERYIRERCFAPYIETQESKVNHDTIDI